MRLRTRKRILDLIERAEGRLIDRLRPWAYPGHGSTLPPVLIFALVKSGSIFIQRALRRTLEVEIQHIGGAGINGGWFSYPDLCRFAKGNAVSREHMHARAEFPSVLAGFNIRRAVVHVRDPRAAIVSWTNQMERNLPSRGLGYVAFSCEQDVPELYLKWSFEQRLRWQIEHVMPRMVAWVDGSVELADRSDKVQFLVTDYAELARDSRAYIEKLLNFYGIPYEESWLKIPRREVGRNNVYSMDSGPGSRPPLSPEISALANAGIPGRLIDRFSWARASA
jgi:hypothetical protein